MRKARAGFAVWTAIVLGGCATAPDIHRRVQDEVAAAVRLEAEPAAESAVEAGSGEPQALETILADVIRANPPYRLALAEGEASEVRRAAARSLPWPRLVAEGSLEVPIEDGESRTDVTGGLYLRLDLMKAFLHRNAVTAADVGCAANRELRRGTALEAALDFFHRAENLDAALRAAKRSEAALELADRASAEADAMFRAGRAAFDRGWTWERRRLEQEIERQRSAAQLDKARREVARAYAGPAPEADILRQVADYVERLAARPEEPAVDLAAILEQSPEVARAKLDLFLAEMAVLEARLKRLPGLSLDLGAGDIPIRGESDEEADLVPMLKISMPLIDMGDISRGVKQARIRAEQSRERMKQAVENAHENWQTVRQDLALAEVSLRAAGSFCDSMAKRRDEIRAFYGSGSASALEVHETEWMQIEAEALRDRAAHEFRLALLAARALRGDLFDEALQSALNAKTGLDSP